MKNAKNCEANIPEPSVNNFSFDKLPLEVYRLREEILSLKEYLNQITANNQPPSEPKKPITSITELAKFLNVARCTAQALKNSGRFPYIQYGKKLVIDPDKVLASLNGYKPKRKKPKTQVQPAGTV